MDLNNLLNSLVAIFGSIAVAAPFVWKSAQAYSTSRANGLKAAQRQLKTEQERRERENVENQSDIRELQTKIDELNAKLERVREDMRKEREENSRRLMAQQVQHANEMKDLQDRLQLANIEREHMIGTIFKLREHMINNGLTPPENI